MAPSSPPSSLEVKRKEEEKGIAILGPQHHYKIRVYHQCERKQQRPLNLAIKLVSISLSILNIRLHISASNYCIKSQARCKYLLSQNKSFCCVFWLQISL
jgi:hypothetical protein